MSLVLSGRVAETVGSKTENAAALSVVAKDSGVIHANDFGNAGAKLARLTLPSGTIGALIDDPARSSGWRWTHDASVAKPFLRLASRARHGVGSFASDDPDVLDLLARFTARPVAQPKGRPPQWLEQTMSELRESWHPGISVADVARRAGVHPVYLARCVRRWYGCGVADELRRLRFHLAASQVAGSSGTISRIAHEGGYSDEPHLSRDFRRLLDVTARDYRRLLGDEHYRWRSLRSA